MQRNASKAFSLLLLACLTSVAPHLNAQGWVPNVVHYINNSPSSNNAAPEFTFDADNTSELRVIDWPSFADEGVIYRLEFKLSGEDSWTLLYEGESSHYVHSTNFDTGNYSFRVSCDGLAACPVSGYLEANIEVVDAPSFVFASYEHEQQTINIHWGESSNVIGYSLEQSADSGSTWEELAPSEGTGIDYSSSDYSGTLHQSSSFSISKSAASQSLILANRAKQQPAKAEYSSSSYDVGSTFKYRVKACADSSCSKSTASQELTISALNGLIPDPTFELGNVQFSDEVGAISTISADNAIEGNHSLDISLSNYGLTQYIHRYTEGEYPILSGATLSAKLRINSIDKDAQVSIYPVAYYVGSNRRVEGQKLVFDHNQAGQTIPINSQMWLNNGSSADNQIKRLHFLIRIIGEGTANITLDNAQLYEGSGLAQTDPVLTAYYSTYSGLINFSWTEFLAEGDVYQLEYKQQTDADWQIIFRGSDTVYERNEAFTESGVYLFRMPCKGVGNCPSNGYVEASTVVAREPFYITALNDESNNKSRVEWGETVSALGYIIEKSSNDGVTWEDVTPSNDNFSYTGSDGVARSVYTKAEIGFDYLLEQGTRFRVKACRWAGCTGRYAESKNIHSTSDVPLGIPSLNSDKTQIYAGEEIFLHWQRPENYTRNTIYNLYVNKHATQCLPEQASFKWQDSIQWHGVSRGGEEGITRLGTQSILIEACNANGCGPLSSTTVTVKDDFIGNMPPVLDGEPAPSIEVGADYLFAASSTDDPEQELIYTIENAPSWLTLNQCSGEIFGTPLADNIGVFSDIQLSVSDGQYTSTLPSFSISVTPKVYKTDSNNLYIDLGNKFIRVSNVGGKWVATEISSDSWQELFEDFTDSGFTFAFEQWDIDGVQGFKLQSTEGNVGLKVLITDEEYLVTSYLRNIIFIHTDLLGTPVAETGKEGGIN